MPAPCGRRWASQGWRDLHRWPAQTVGFDAVRRHLLRAEREKGPHRFKFASDAHELFPEPIDFFRREAAERAVRLSEHRRQYPGQHIGAARRQRNGDAPAVGRPLVTHDQVLVLHQAQRMRERGAIHRREVGQPLHRAAGLLVQHRHHAPTRVVQPKSPQVRVQGALAASQDLAEIVEEMRLQPKPRRRLRGHAATPLSGGAERRF